MTAAAQPFLVLDHGHGPFQAWCRCGWRSRWRTTARMVRAEHDRHLVAAHGRPPTVPLGLSRRSGRR
jgi:hypothetical protein